MLDDRAGLFRPGWIANTSVYGLDDRTASRDGRVAWSSSCSRNAHAQKVLVRRAHLRIDQATLKEMGDKEDGRSEGVNLFTKERKISVPYWEPQLSFL
jgi:hypothetical protein